MRSQGGVARRVFASYFRGKFGDRRYPGTERVPPGRLPSADRLPDDGPRDVLDELIAREEAELAEAEADDTLDAGAGLLRDALLAPTLAGLSPATREAVEMVLDGVSPAEAADRAGVPVKDVKLRIRNACRSVWAKLPQTERERVRPALEAALPGFTDPKYRRPKAEPAAVA